MVPPAIESNLAALRRRERLLTFVWGGACWLAIVLIMLLMSAFIDWIIDQQRETPFAVRFGLFVVQLFVAATAGFWFLIWPQLRRLPDEMLALWVEDKCPHFDHRLISAVQFNQRGAVVEGMSVELIRIVTKEAEKAASHVSFSTIADHNRLKWSAIILGPVLLLAMLPVLIWPGLSLALVARQALLPIDIPHSVSLESITREVLPIGDRIKIIYRVTGQYHEKMVGSVLVTPKGQPSDVYELRFIQSDDKGAIFGADVQPSSVDLHYSARLADGRTRLPSVLRMVPRPGIVENLAWIQLPEYCGLRKDGRRFEEQQGLGRITGIPGSRVRIRIKTQKPIKEAFIVLLTPDPHETRKSEEEGPIPDVDKETRKIPLSQMTDSFEYEFDLTPGLSGYRLVVKDEYGFDNQPQPRRALALEPEPPPTVTLLRDTFGAGADFDLEGLPVILGGKIRVPYYCEGKYGLGKANLLYRVLKKHESGNEPVEEERWTTLPLPEVKADPQLGLFDVRVGVFQGTPFDRAVPFHAMPANHPDKQGRKAGGGRVFLETDGLIDSKGKALKLKSGDQIEYCIEVYGAHRQPEASIPVGRSETRVSSVMRVDEFSAWLSQVSKEDEKIKHLKQQQENVFSSPK